MIFQKILQIGTQLNFGIAYHSQTDGHNEIVNQVLEDMLSMYVMDKLGKWEDYLQLVEFAYNNNFQVSVGMNHFEILYGCKCNLQFHGALSFIG